MQIISSSPPIVGEQDAVDAGPAPGHTALVGSTASENARICFDVAAVWLGIRSGPALAHVLDESYGINTHKFGWCYGSEVM